MIQYGHQKYTIEEQKHHDNELIEGTIAVDIPDKGFFNQMMVTHSSQIMLLTGLAIKSQKDQYRYSKGRELAKSRLVPVVFRFIQVESLSTRHIYHFTSNIIYIGSIEYTVDLQLTTVAESERVYLIYANIKKAKAR